MHRHPETEHAALARELGRRVERRSPIVEPEIHALAEHHLRAQVVGIAQQEPELHLGEDIVVPDLAGWRRERMPELPHVAAIELGPDWCCEVLSKSTAAIDRGEKLPIYARERVAYVWLVDPIVKTLEALRLDEATYRIVATYHDDAKVRVEPFDAIELDLTILWAR